MDLSRRDPRERISKSFLQTVEACGQKAWRSIHDPRPWSPPEKVTFGSAVDAGVELIIGYWRSGQDPDMDRSLAASMARVAGDPVQPDQDQVWEALDSFRVWPTARAVDWTHAITQHHIRLELVGVGEVDAHPDIIVGPGVIDVKTGARARPANAAATSYTELALYALLREVETGHPVEWVAYWTFVRTKRPYWDQTWAPVTGHMLAVARHRVAAVARALEADSLLNDGMAVPTNSVFVTGPRYGCQDCQYRGDCEIEEESDVPAAA